MELFFIAITGNRCSLHRTEGTRHSRYSPHILHLTLHSLQRRLQLK